MKSFFINHNIMDDKVFCVCNSLKRIIGEFMKSDKGFRFL